MHLKKKLVEFFLECNISHLDIEKTRNKTYTGQSINFISLNLQKLSKSKVSIKEGENQWTDRV